MSRIRVKDGIEANGWHTVLARLRRSSLRAEMLVGYLVVVGLTMVVGVAALFSQYRSEAAFNHLIDVEDKIAELSAGASAAMLKARRAEKDFLLFRRELGFTEAKARYVTLVRTNVGEVREQLQRMRRLTDNPGTIARMESIEHLLVKYQDGFLRTVDLYSRLGHIDAGLEGAVRREAKALETFVATRGLGDRLMVDLLQLRRYEKDYITRGLRTDAEEFAARAAALRAHVFAARLPETVDKTLRTGLTAYERAFREYVDVDDEIDESKTGYLAAAHAAEPLLEELYLSTDDEVASMRARVQATARATDWAVIGATLAALLIGIGVAQRTSRRVAGAVAECRDFAETVARGDLTTRIVPRGQHEFRTLASALNDMTEALLASRVSLEARANELADSNRALRGEIDVRERTEAELRRIARARKMLTDCNRALAHAASERALLGSMCRIVVETGGYRMAWVGYGRHDDAKTIEVMAHAGADPVYVATLGNARWSEEAGSNGMVGAAIRTALPQLIRDIHAGPNVPVWHALAVERGVAAVLAFPLCDEKGVVFGAVGFYSAESKAFDELEIELLAELTNDVAYGIVSLRTAIARTAAEAALRLRTRAIESSVNAIFIARSGAGGQMIEYVNPAFERLTGYMAVEASGRAPEFLQRHDTAQAGLLEIQAALRDRREGHAVLRSFRKDDSVFWNELYIAPVRDDAGAVTHYIGVLNDITGAKEYEAQLERQANFDALTGLANRNLLQDRLRQAIAAARRRRDGVVVAFLDLDQFKFVNDSLGHNIGDELLKTAAARLKSCLRESDTVARLGGDEFVLLLHMAARAPSDAARAAAEPLALEARATELMRRVLAVVAQPVDLAGQEIRVSCSIGLSVYPQDGENGDVLLRNAEAAMYRAKESGRNAFQFFTGEIHERVRRHMELESSLRLALEREEFELHYQPQVSLKDGRIISAEALLRWRHPQHGLIGPGQFIALAEESGLIIPIGEWVLARACAQARAWQQAGLPPIVVSVNVSAKQWMQQNIEAVVHSALQASGLAPQFLELELTETVSMANPETMVALMERLKRRGVSIAIDDFGTGYSSMSYLKRFPIDRLKLDICFVREITADRGSRAISQAIITMAHSLNLQVVAEGVETEGQLKQLATFDCDQIQGYYFSRPVPADTLAEMLLENRSLRPVRRVS